jgi:ferredoxin
MADEVAYQVSVDKDVCISSGKCVADVPSLFRFDDDDLAEVVPQAPQPTNDELITIARQCPSLAVVLRNGATGETIDID